MEQILRDSSRNVIGFLRTDGNGTQTAYDSSRNRLGHYDPCGDITYDASRNLVGEGNLLGTLFCL